MEWQTVIGLEVHVQLATHSKIFSGAATDYGAEANTQACQVDLGLPGVLPVLNKKAVTLAVKFGLAIDADIQMRSIFARKNYFYPDLPKGYQISQYELPIVGKGHLDIQLPDGTKKRIGITRAHLEEDAGKSLHEDYQGMTGIDLNRAGTPLLEIVSEPEMHSAQEAVAYLKALHTLVRYLGISDGNMQEGSFRCDVNVSIRPKGQTEFGTRTECKNINSFRFVERAIHYEVERQIALLESGQSVRQETRLYDPDKNETRSMRGKEDAHDYRYFPDPDLLPVIIDDALLESLQRDLPELPQAKQKRFIEQYHLSQQDAEQLISQPALAHYFEEVAQQTNQPKLAANWILGELSAQLNKHQLAIDACPVSTMQLVQLIARINDQTLSSRTAKTVFEALWAQQGQVDDIIEKQGLKQMSDSGQLAQLVDDIIAKHPQQVEQYRAGKTKLMGFFVGQIMKATQGKANPAQLNDILTQKLADD